MESGYPSPAMNEAPQNNKKLLFVGLFLVVIVMFLATIAFILSNVSRKTANQTTAQNTNTGSSNTTTSQNQTQSGSTAPTVKFAKWVEPKITPAPVTSATVYSFKQNYSQNEVKTLAQKLDANKITRNNGAKVISYSLNNNKDVNILDFDTGSGSFSYLNTSGVTLPPGSDTNNRVYSFLQSLNLYDPTLKLTATYKRKDSPGIVVYEIHRDWSAVGMPILNFNGLFNLPETQPLTGITLATKNPGLATDESIYDTSDGKDGYARASDFNTMSIFVTEKSQKVVGITSSLRQLKNTGSKVPMLSYKDALAKLKNNNYTYIFTTPSGEGQVAWNKIYPNNEAIADDAVVNESVNAYLENMPFQAQKDLKPYYLFRGTSVLNSGYSVDFIAAVSALPNDQAMNQMNKNVLGVSTLAQSDPGLQQANISVNPENPPTLGPSEPPSNPAACHPTKTELTASGVPHIDKYGVKLALLTYRWVFKQNQTPQWQKETDKNGNLLHDPRWYWIPPDTVTTLSPTQQLGQLWNDYQTILAHRHEFDTEMLSLSNGEASFYGINHQGQQVERPWDLIQKDFLLQYAFAGGACPNVFSGLSPAIFVYGKPNQHVDITSGAKLTYADPSTDNNTWNVTVQSNDSLLVNNVIKPYVYYEYAPMQFNRPTTGWNVDKNNVESFINQLSTKMGLKSAETNRLQHEIQNVLGDVNGNAVFIGMIDQNEVNTKLPLTFNPAPQNIQRYHFYVGPVNSKIVTAPQIQPVTRTEYMAIEFGAVSGK